MRMRSHSSTEGAAGFDSKYTTCRSARSRTHFNYTAAFTGCTRGQTSEKNNIKRNVHMKPSLHTKASQQSPRRLTPPPVGFTLHSCATKASLDGANNGAAEVRVREQRQVWKNSQRVLQSGVAPHWHHPVPRCSRHKALESAAAKSRIDK